MNTETNNSRSIVVYSPDFAAQQAGFVAGYNAAKSAASAKTVDEMSLDELLKVVNAKLRDAHPKRKPVFATVQGKRPRAQNAHYPNPATPDFDYQTGTIGQALTGEIIFGPSREELAEIAIAAKNAEVIASAKSAVEKWHAYRQPIQERVTD